MRMYQFWKYALILPLMRTWIRPRVAGLEHVPAEGPVLLVVNHVGTWDPILVGALLEREVHFVAKAELFAPGGSPRHRVVAWVMGGLGQVPMDRGAATLDPVLAVLAQDEVVGIFPEGTRSPDGRLYRAKTGAARLLLASGAIAVPVVVDGTQPGHGLRSLIPRHPHITFGAPRSYDDLRGRADDYDVVRWLSDDLAAALQELSGQTYVDVYAAEVKKGHIGPAEVEASIIADPRRGRSRPQPR